MLTRLRIKNFKNFHVEQDILVFENERDTMAFTIFVGKNGAGKSSAFDAIEWVLFKRSTKSMRASNQNDLISDGQDFMYVQVSFENRIGNLSLVVTKELHKGKQSQISASLTGIYGTSSIAIDNFLEGYDQIANALQQCFDINVSHFEKVVVKQRSISAISCAEPKLLLASLEVYIGTDVIKTAAESFIADRDLIFLERKTISTARHDLAVEIGNSRPAVDDAINLRREKHLFAKSLVQLRELEERALERSEASQVLQCRELKNIELDVLHDLQLAAALKKAMREEIGRLNIAGSQKRRAAVSCEEVLYQEQEILENMILLRNQAVQKSCASAAKVKGIMDLVSKKSQIFFSNFSCIYHRPQLHGIRYFPRQTVETIIKTRS